MPELRVIDGGNDFADAASAAFDQYNEIDDVEFALPPNLYVGLVTGLIGAAAGLVSLIIYFHLWDPAPYISPQWLTFAALGATAGFFLRLEAALPQLFLRTDD